MAANGSDGGHVTSVTSTAIGSGYLLESLVVLVFYVPCLKVIRTDHHMRNHSCFRLMYHLGLCDMIHLCIQGIGGYFILTDLWYKVPLWLNHLLSGVLDAFGWVAYLAFLHCIALNRVIEICGSQYSKDRFFSANATKKWITGCWLWGCIWLSLMLSPWGGFVYYTHIYTFYYDHNTPWYPYIKEFAKYHAMFQLFMSAFWYMVILINVRREHRLASHHTSEMMVREHKIVKQAAIICIYPLIGDTYWHLTPLLSEMGFGAFVFALGNTIWLSSTAINPLVYLTINESISSKVRTMFGIRANEVAQAPTARQQPSRRLPRAADSRL